MKRNIKKLIIFIGAFFISISMAQAATAKKLFSVPAPAVATITYTITFNNDTPDAYFLLYPALGKTLSSDAITCCDNTIDSETCLNHGPLYHGSVPAGKSITLVCPTREQLSTKTKTLKTFAPSRFFSLESCEVVSNAKGNNQVNVSSCHVVF